MMLFDLLIIIRPVLTLNVSYYNMGWQVADDTVTEGALMVSVAIMNLYYMTVVACKWCIYHCDSHVAGWKGKP